MFSVESIEIELDEGNTYLSSGQPDMARAKFALAIALIAQNAKTSDRIGGIGGSIAGVTIGEGIDILCGGRDHPLLSGILGGIAGHFAGKAGAKAYAASSHEPLHSGCCRPSAMATISLVPFNELSVELTSSLSSLSLER